jgi:hypothetical protein
VLPRYGDHSPASQRRSSHERSQPTWLRSEDADLQVLSEDSLDDAELYGQLLLKFTRHELHDRVDVDENADEHVEQDSEGQVSTNVDRGAEDNVDADLDADKVVDEGVQRKHEYGCRERRSSRWRE